MTSLGPPLPLCLDAVLTISASTTSPFRSQAGSLLRSMSSGRVFATRGVTYFKGLPKYRMNLPR